MMPMNRSSHTKRLALAALFLAMGLTLPFLTGQIPQIGNLLLPMHIPVLVCGLICGWKYGGVIGLILPPMRYLLFGAPPFPNNVAMACELAAYGALVGLLYARSRRKGVVSLYRSLIAAMLGGRIVWGAAMIAIIGAAGKSFTWAAFLTSAFFNAIPGIVLQLVFIPALMVALDRTGMIPFQPRAELEAGTAKN